MIKWKTFPGFPDIEDRQPRRVKPRRLFCERLEPRHLLATITLTPIADNTLYEDATGNLSNALGQFLYVGDTNQTVHHIRRAVLKFDLSAVPAGSVINGAALQMNMSRTNDTVPQVTALRRLLKDWGEGTSNAGLGPLGEGAGAQATPGDATWFYTSFSTEFWATPGGDFIAEPSAATPVGGVGKYFWTSAGMAADVQQWVNLPATNFGWILTGNETDLGTARQFDSKDNAIPQNRPVLTIDFSEPSPDLTVAKSHTPARFRQGDPAETYTILVSNRGSLPTAGLVTVTDTLPPGVSPTEANNRTINGWNVMVAGQTVTATRNDALSPGGIYAPLPIIVSVSPTAPSRVTNIVTVAGGGELNTTNNSASDPTIIIPMPDLTVTKTHTGDFQQGERGRTFTITVTNVGGASTPRGRVVSVKDVLPVGMKATALRGQGWTTNLRTLTARRSNALGPGESYPPLILTVRVGPNAPSLLTNTVRVAGGGQLNRANDTATDPVTIVPAGLPAIALSVIDVSPVELAVVALAVQSAESDAAPLPLPVSPSLESAPAVDQAMASVADWSPAGASSPESPAVPVQLAEAMPVRWTDAETPSLDDNARRGPLDLASWMALAEALSQPS
jgi:uncharacterized repeat protein (TIGR01451 family)